MKQGVKLDDDQEKVFQELEALFRGEAGGWEKLQSPYEGVEMEIRRRTSKERRLELPWGELWALQTAQQRRLLHGTLSTAVGREWQ